MKIPFTNIELGGKQASGPPASGTAITGAVLKLGPIEKPTLRPFRGDEWSQKRIVRPNGQRMFAAAQSSRLTADWPVSISSANAEIQVSAIATRSRLRQLERDDDYMRRMLRLFQNNVVGHLGIQLQMKIKDAPTADAPKGKYDTGANLMVQNAWKRALSKKNCTVSRNMSGIKLQRLAIRCVKRDGAMIVRIWRGFSNEFGFAVQPLEIDYLDFFRCGRNPTNGNRIYFGIEVDDFMAPVAYWLLNRHPGDVFGPDEFRGQAYATRVPADEIMILGDLDRAGQILGMPDFCSVATKLNMLHKTLEAVAVATRVAACKGGFIKKQMPTGWTGPEDERGSPIEDLSPGTIEELEVGEEFQANDPTQPTDALQPFIKEELRGASAGAGLDYAAVANDRENENYSSLKAGRLESIEQYEWDQTNLIEELMEPWFENWVPFAILTKKIAMPITKLQKILDGAKWQPRTWQSVEPLKEVQADALEVKYGFESRRQKVADRGRDIEDVDEEQEEDNLSAEKHGLGYSQAEPEGKLESQDDSQPEEEPAAAAPAKK